MSHLTAAAQREAREVLDTFTESGAELDVFIVSHLEQDRVDEIAATLTDVLKQSSGNEAKIAKFRDTLKDVCSQDLCDQGMRFGLL